MNVVASVCITRCTWKYNLNYQYYIWIEKVIPWNIQEVLDLQKSEQIPIIPQLCKVFSIFLDLKRDSLSGLKNWSAEDWLPNLYKYEML